MKKEIFEDKVNHGKLWLRHGDIIGVDLGAYDPNVWDIRGLRPAMVIGEYGGVNKETVIRIIPLTKNTERYEMGQRDRFYAVEPTEYRDRGTFGLALVDNERDIKGAQVYKIGWDGVYCFVGAILQEISLVRSVVSGRMSKKRAEGLRKYFSP